MQQLLRKCRIRFRQNVKRSRNFKSRSGTGVISLLLPLLLLKFVSVPAAVYDELRKRDTSPASAVFDHADERQLAERMGDIHAVADHEEVGTDEADMVGFDRLGALARLLE